MRKTLAILAALIVVSGAGYSVYLKTRNTTNNSQSQTKISEPRVTANSVSNTTSDTDTPSTNIATKPISTSRSIDSGSLRVDVDVNADVITTTDCGSEDCFRPKFVTCEHSTVTVEGDPVDLFGAARYEIVGPTTGGCKMIFKYTKNPNSDWVNKEMTCAFDNTIALEDSISKVFEGIFDGSVACDGPLYTLLHSSAQ